MNTIATIATSYGRQRATHPARRILPGEASNPLDHAAALDREADWHLAEGRGQLADRLAHLALEHRCKATGGRA